MRRRGADERVVEGNPVLGSLDAIPLGQEFPLEELPDIGVLVDDEYREIREFHVRCLDVVESSPLGKSRARAAGFEGVARALKLRCFCAVQEIREQPEMAGGCQLFLQSVKTLFSRKITEQKPVSL